jgi:hypothetical protein
MQTVIGLGQAGCRIAEQLAQYPQYDVLKIDAGATDKDRKLKNALTLKERPTPEAYEKEGSPRLKTFFKDVYPETLFITSCGNVSALSLRILEHIRKKSKITVMYIIPDKTNLAENQKLHNNLLFNVFQEYARSGVFERMILIDNQAVATLVGAVPILKYWDALNGLIASTYHMVNVFDHSRPVFTTFSNKVQTARQTTLGPGKWMPEEKNEEKMFFSLDFPREKRYYYAVPQKILEEDENLMANIQKQVKDAIEHDKMKVGYAIYSTQYDQPYVYCEGYSTLIQKNPVS